MEPNETASLDQLGKEARNKGPYLDNALKEYDIRGLEAAMEFAQGFHGKENKVLKMIYYKDKFLTEIIKPTFRRDDIGFMRFMFEPGYMTKDLCSRHPREYHNNPDEGIRIKRIAIGISVAYQLALLAGYGTFVYCLTNAFR